MILDLMYSTFLDTTDPTTPYTSLFSIGVASSILLHGLIYFLVFLLLAEFFDWPNDRSTLITVAGGLVLIMIAGYIGRLARSKSIMDVQIKRGESMQGAKQIAIQTLRPAYFTWYFMA